MYSRGRLITWTSVYREKSSSTTTRTQLHSLPLQLPLADTHTELLTNIGSIPSQDIELTVEEEILSFQVEDLPIGGTIVDCLRLASEAFLHRPGVHLQSVIYTSEEGVLVR